MNYNLSESTVDNFDNIQDFIQFLNCSKIEEIQQIYNENKDHFIGLLLYDQVFFSLEIQIQMKILKATNLDSQQLFNLSMNQIQQEIDAIDIFFNNSTAYERVYGQNENENKEISIVSFINEKGSNFSKGDLKKIIFKKGYKSISSLLYEYLIKEKYPKIEIIQKFIDCGCDINVRKENDNSNLLIISMESNNIKVASFLLENGIDINTRNENAENPLMIAAQQKSTKLIRLILNHSKFHNFDFCNEEDKNGNLILHHICKIPEITKETDYFKEIFYQTKDKTHENKTGITPYGICLQTMNQDLIDFFIDYSKKQEINLINSETNFLFFLFKQKATKFIIQHLNEMNDFFDSTNQFYQTPLFYSIIYSDSSQESKELIEKLLKFSCYNINDVD